MPISFSLFIYNIPASQILHARVLFLTNFVQRYELSLTLPNFSRLFLHSRNRPYCVLERKKMPENLELSEIVRIFAAEYPP